MKVLVTGGAGFIGSHVVEYFIRDGHEVVIIDDLSSGKKEYVHPKAKFYRGDIRDSQIKEIFAQEKFDIVDHHAAQISVRYSVADPLTDADINILGLLNILEAAQKTGVKKIIFSSSGGAIYGDAKTIPTPEDYEPLHPLSPYGIAKLTSEYYLSFYWQTYQLPSVMLRYSNVYGPRQDPHGEAGVVAIFTQSMLKHRETIINGDGEQVRDFVYVEDVARANLRALMIKDGGVFNIGTEKGTTISTIFTLLKDLTKSRIKKKYGPAKAGEQRQSILSCLKAKEVLGWEANIELEQGLKKTVDYFRSQAIS